MSKKYYPLVPDLLPELNSPVIDLRVQPHHEREPEAYAGLVVSGDPSYPGNPLMSARHKATCINMMHLELAKWYAFDVGKLAIYVRELGQVYRQGRQATKADAERAARVASFRVVDGGAR